MSDVTTFPDEVIVVGPTLQAELTVQYGCGLDLGFRTQNARISVYLDREKAITLATSILRSMGAMEIANQ